MLRQPRLNFLALVHAHIVQNDVNLRLRSRYFPVKLLQKRDQLLLPLPFGGHFVNLARAGVKCREQIQGSATAVLVFDTHWAAWTARQCRRFARPGLKARHLVQAKDDFVVGQSSGVKVANPLHLIREGGVSRHLGRQPHPLAPGLEPMMSQNLAYRFWRDFFDHAITYKLPGDLTAIPLRQRSAQLIGPFACNFHDVNGDHRGKKPACVRGRVDP